MSFELAPGTLLNNRYQIKKVISFANDGGVYLARDLKVTDKNWVVKELIPSAELDEETLTARRTLFSEAVESAMQFDQPSLPKILDYFSEARREYVVMENVDGVTLQALCDMSVNPLPEKQILTWTLQICDALIYLHNRPKPFIFGALEPAHIILTPDEKIKLINFGLDRFFGFAAPPKVFADDPSDVLQEFNQFGETICFLLTKEKPGIYGLPSTANVTPETAKVINLTLQGDQQKAYNNFDDVRKELDLALNPPSQPKGGATTTGTVKTKRKVHVPGEIGAPPAWLLALNRGASAFISQRPALLWGEIGGFLVLLIGLFWFLHGTPYHKSGPTAYLATNKTHELVSLLLSDHKVADRQGVNGSIADMAVAGSWLYVSDANSNRLLRYDTETNEMPEKNGTIPVDRNPTAMTLDDRNHYLYVLHEPTHNISRVNLNRDPPQMDAIMAVPHTPSDLAITTKGDLLFVASRKGSTVALLDPDNNKTLGEVAVTGSPYGMAASPEGSGLGQLWVCCQDPDSVIVIDIASQQVKQTIVELSGGKKPTSALFSLDGSKVYISMAGSNNVVVFDSSKLAATKTIQTAENPTRLIYTPSLNQIWAICTSGSKGVTMIDPTSDAPAGNLDVAGTTGAAAMAK